MQSIDKVDQFLKQCFSPFEDVTYEEIQGFSIVDDKILYYWFIRVVLNIDSSIGDDFVDYIKNMTGCQDISKINIVERLKKMANNFPLSDDMKIVITTNSNDALYHQRLKKIENTYKDIGCRKDFLQIQSDTLSLNTDKFKNIDKLAFTLSSSVSMQWKKNIQYWIVILNLINYFCVMNMLILLLKKGEDMVF